MTELDVDGLKLVSLKHELAKVAEDPDEFTLQASEIRPLLVALEDRDRLRAAVSAALLYIWGGGGQEINQAITILERALESRDG